MVRFPSRAALALTALAAASCVDLAELDADASVERAPSLSDLLPAAVPAVVPPDEDAVAAPEEAVEAPVATAPAGEPSWDLPNFDHPRVDEFIAMFTGRKRDEFAGFLARKGRYEAMISRRLAQRDMPQDLLYLAMIESGFKANAYSSAHASGIWQFIAETGRRYGLEVNAAVDERRDFERATDAALSYLQDLHDRFGSWYLAAAAYNTGENRVGRIMREVTGTERGNERSYFRIRERLPKETRDYVPLMIAAARISKEPHKYGFGDVVYDAPLDFDRVVVPAGTPLAAVARAAGTDVDGLRALNPQLKLDRTRSDAASRLRVPVGAAPEFHARLRAVAPSTAVAQARPEAPAVTVAAAASAAPTVRVWRVKRGESLSFIAARTGTTVAALKKANRMRDDRIVAGSTLVVPKG